MTPSPIETPIKTPAKKSGRAFKRFFKFLCLLIVLALIGTGIWFAYPKVMQFKLAQSAHQIQLAQTQTNVQTVQSQLTQVQTQVAELQEQLQGTKATLAQVTGQLQQQQSVLAQIRQDPAAKGLLPSEINYLIQLAHASLIAQHNTADALMFLKTALNLATFSYEPQLSPVVAALNQDIAALQTVDQADVATILGQLAIAQNIVEKMNFVDIPTTQTPTPSAAGNGANQSTLPWWKQMYVSGVAELKKLVVVQKVQTNTADSFNQLTLQYLKQNIELLLTQTELAVAQYNQALYQANLSELQNLIETHLANQPGMDQVLTIVKTLQSANIAPPLPDVDASQIAINQILNNPRPTPVMAPNPQPATLPQAAPAVAPAPVTAAPTPPQAAQPAPETLPAGTAL